MVLDLWLGYGRVFVGRCVLAATIGAALTACGSETSRADPIELMEQLPIGRHDVIYFIDLDATRDALDLPPDADPFLLASPPEISDAEQALQAATREILKASSPTPPVYDALDLGQASAVVSNDKHSDEGMALIVTDQSFDEIATVLEAEGYVRDGDVLSSDRPLPEIFYPHIAGGDGVIALSTSPEPGGAEIALAAAEGSRSPTGGLARELAADVDTPAVVAVAIDGTCVQGVAVAERFADGEDVITLRTRGEAMTDRFVPDLPGGWLEPGEVTADGNSLEAEVRSQHPSSNVLGAHGHSFAISELYDCPDT